MNTALKLIEFGPKPGRCRKDILLHPEPEQAKAGRKVHKKSPEMYAKSQGLNIFCSPLEPVTRLRDCHLHLV